MPLSSYSRDLRLEFIATGNELLDGSLSDTNSRWLAERLRPLGCGLRQVSVVSDDRGDIQREFLQSFSRADIIVLSGGLGPTTDDLTLEAVAEVLGLPMVFSMKAHANIKERLKALGRTRWNAGHEKQCLVPEGAEVLVNRSGTAPGICLRIQNREIYFFPGVPKEFYDLVQSHLLPRLLARAGRSGKEYLFVYKVFGWPESELNELMKRAKRPTDVTVGYRTILPENHLKFFVRAGSRAEAVRKLRPLDRWLRRELGISCFTTELTQSFSNALMNQLRSQKQRVAVAESCTGGGLSSLITSESGSSEIFDCGFITYSNDSKERLLGVRRETLHKYGAVSEAVAREMALGVLKNSQADRSVATTGISGPTGGTNEKPVGLVWVAWADRKSKRVRAEAFYFPFGRELHQKLTAAVAYFGLVHPKATFHKWSQVPNSVGSRKKS